MSEENAIKTDIRSMDLKELEAYLTDRGEPGFRAKQLFGWLHEKRAVSYQEMKNLPGKLREELEGQTHLTVLRPVQILTSRLDGTRKYLFELPDGHVIESVLMRYRHGNSVCISSQVGCRMGCKFCASTIGGRIRDLTAGEMLEQVYRIGEITKERVSNVVVMGTGEPLDNYDQLLRFLKLLTDPRGQNISQRNITVSTCGLADRILMLAEEKLTITLAISLHASSQEKREKLMPVARRYHLTEVMDACRVYYERTGRRLTFEYSLVAGVNDGREDARELISLLRGLNCHVNLIPVNPVRERSFRAPDRNGVLNFQRMLEQGGITATIRREMGRDINGACGQLRRDYQEHGGRVFTPIRRGGSS